METSTFQSIKLSLVSASGLSKDALHIYIGMGVFVLSAVLFRKSIGSWLPIGFVLLAAILGEALDLRDNLGSLGAWRWKASVHDLINTSFWPVVLFGLSRFTKIFRTSNPA